MLVIPSDENIPNQIIFKNIWSKIGVIQIKPQIYVPAIPCRLDISNIIYKHYLCPKFYKQLIRDYVKNNPTTIPGLP